MTDKSSIIYILKGYSCSNCRYRLTDEKVHNYGRPHRFLSGVPTITMDSPVPYCALRTDTKGKRTERSELHEDHPCRHYWKKESRHKIPRF